MKKLIIIYILTIYFIPLCISQQYTKNELKKYWYYRQRLKDNFMVVGYENVDCGTGSGLSLPGDIGLDSDGNPASISWGDISATLGWYIGVLATEIRLLYNHNLPYSETLEELDYAMKAYNRLDRIAEGYFYPDPNPDNCSLNGFFARDDVPEDFLINHPIIIKGNSLEFEKSDYSEHDPLFPDQNSYPSPDQIAGLFMGFALVKKCLEGINDAYVRRAQESTLRIVNTLANYDWKGVYPNKPNEQYMNGKCFLEEFHAYGYAKAAEFILKGWLGPTEEDKYSEPFENASFQKIMWNQKGQYTGFGITWFDTYKNQGPWHDFSIAYQLNIAAIADTWENTNAALAFYGKRYNMEFYHLLYRYLHDKENEAGLNKTLLGHILMAPCEGPWNRGGDYVVSTPGWRVGNRYTRSFSAATGANPDGTDEKKGMFRGLDYMLLNNLFWLVVDENYFSTLYSAPSSETKIPNFYTLSNNLRGTYTDNIPIKIRKPYFLSDLNVEAGDYLFITAPGITIENGFFFNAKLGSTLNLNITTDNSACAFMENMVGPDYINLKKNNEICVNTPLLRFLELELEVEYSPEIYNVRWKADGVPIDDRYGCNTYKFWIYPNKPPYHVIETTLELDAYTSHKKTFILTESYENVCGY